jgi:hypothetical protein
LIVANVVSLANKVLIGSANLSKGREVDYSAGLSRVKGGVAGCAVEKRQEERRRVVFV